jgi:hypothetical protein
LLALAPALPAAQPAPGEPEAIAADAAEPAAPPEKPYGWKQLGWDARFLFQRPFRLEGKGKIKLAATLGGVALLYAARDDVRDLVRDNPSESRQEILDDARVMGSGKFGAAVALAALGASVVTRNPREKETAFLLLESMGYSAVLAAAGSYVLASERPGDGDSVSFFDADGRGVSLDAALASSVIGPLRRQYLRVRPEDAPGKRFWKRTATGLLYAGAGLTALQRIEADKHWAPDAALGFVTGLSVGETLARAHDAVPEPRARLDAGPTAAGVGVQVTFRIGRPHPSAAG